MIGVGTGVQQDLDHDIEVRAVRFAQRGMERGLSGFRIGVVRIRTALAQVSAQFPMSAEGDKAQSEVGADLSGFEPVPGWNTEIIQSAGDLNLSQLPSCNTLEPLKPFHSATGGERFRIGYSSTIRIAGASVERVSGCAAGVRRCAFWRVI